MIMVAMENHRQQHKQQLTNSPDDRVLKALMEINDPRNVPDSLPSYRELPPTPQLLSNVKERYIRPNAQPEEEMDEDDIRTRRYWKRWGNRAAKDLVKIIDREKLQRNVKRRELVYSARVREPVYRQDSCDSDDSSDTAISLLTTSSMAAAKDNVKFNLNSNSKKAKTATAPRVDWEKFARQRTGLIDRMMRNDASALGSMVGGGVDSVDVNARERASDIMSEEERLMLRQCAYRKGLSGTSKSKSTENVVTIWPKRPFTAKVKSIPEVVTPLRPASRSTIRGTRPPSGASVSFAPIRSENYPSRGNTPTPRDIRRHLEKSQRSDSAILHQFPVDDERIGSAYSKSSRTKSIVSNSVPNSVKKYMDGVKGLPDFEGVFSRGVRDRIQRTVSALERIVGDGDELDTIAPIPGEVGRYTTDDYALRPKYPQRVLIIPQLASVIKTDIKLRMGRPRLHQIKRHDIKYFDKQNPKIDRSHRNLLIYNWLISISEDDFENQGAPDIVDIEGELADYKNVLRHDDVMSHVHSSLSHVSAGMSDGGDTGFSFSDMDHVSMGAASDDDDDDDAKTDGDRMSPGLSYLSSSRPGTSCKT